ncbi:dioxygenase [Streptomyces sp. 13-12-16]|uniref:VOC family protein n=1 Tax=Streptomyces sp. 13-12-16 TaxID=1570823 RepID=UPI000A1E3E2F|nr:VOC family protein [Streptomyces sp. 13-12-16]OSP45246.1 dioxygenase [Streptomyces sp. 13-12-16]
MKAQSVPPVPPLPHTYLHHIAVQTTDLDNCTAWYRDFLGCRRTWATDRFSDLTVSRLPGIVRMAELVHGDTRFHLFERAASGEGRPHPHETQFQHVCMAVDSPDALRRWRGHWSELARSGRYEFSLPDPPTDVVMDDDGVESFYCLDVNGLEFEFTHVPATAS